MSDVKRSEGEPHDRLTRICDRVIDAFDADPEKGEAKMVIFIDDPETKRGGLVIHGYEDDVDAVVNVIFHLKAIFEANGKTLMIMPVGEG